MWPGRRCDRCLKYGYICSASETKSQGSTRLSHRGLEEAQDLPSSREGSLERVDRPRRSEAQWWANIIFDLQIPLTIYSSLQDLGDIRQLIVCFNDPYQRHYGPVHVQTLTKALQDVVKETEVWAQQYEADGRYKDAAYLHSRIHSDLTEENEIVHLLAAVYEKIGDYPAAELAQEKLMRIILDNFDEYGTDEELVSEVQTLSRLLNLFHTRLQVLGSASQTYAKLSIVRRAARLDLEQLNIALFDQGLIVLDYLDQPNTSSLHIAIQRRAPNLAQLLLQKGANPNLQDNNGDTPLHIAVRYRIEAMVKLLLQWDAHIEIEDMRGSTPIQSALSRGRNELILLLLIEKGANIDTRDFEWRTPLCNAIDFDLPSSAQILIRHGADVNATLNASNDRRTLLCQAVRQGKEWAVKLLLEKGANPHKVDDFGQQALYYAIEAGHESMVRVFIDHGGIQHVTAGPTGKTTLLHLAVCRENLTIIEMILKAGADTNEQNIRGDTPLHESMYYSSGNLVQKVGLLLKFGAQVNMGNNHADTPLHLAAHYGQSAVVQMLLDAGADPQLPNMSGETAMDLARKWSSWPNSDPRYEKMVQVLNAHIAANPRGTLTSY